MSLPTHEDQVLLLHNPRCSKSRAVHEILLEKGVEFEVRPYLDEPLSADELGELEKRLEKPIAEWVRPREAAWGEAGATPDGDREAVVSAVAANPILMERPIVVRGKRAVVGRPPEGVLALFA